MRPRNCACVTVPVVGNGHGVACAEDEPEGKKAHRGGGFQVNIDYLPAFQGQEEEKSTKQKQLKQTPLSLLLSYRILFLLGKIISWLSISFRLKPLVELLSSASSVDFPVLVDSLNSSEGEGAASIALPVKTLGLGASVSSVHPRSAGQITTRAGSIESFSSAHVPTTTSAAILTSMEGYGGSPAAAPTPLPGALI
ncbi:hypothetical protein L1987_89771 [Smallanthus sonchifolius]|nr:hypothetical protein L1987_89771 [Smallanthus sonchifolius]